MAGRAKHLGRSIICKRWWKEHLNALGGPTHQPVSDKSSSEVGSDEEGTQTPMDLDQEPWYGGSDDEATEYPNIEDAEFTSSPSGIDSRSAELIGAAEPAITAKEYPGAAQAVGESKNLYAQIWESDKLYESRKIGGEFYPFSGSVEWEVVEWLHSLDVPMEKIDRFFGLEYVRSRAAKRFESLTRF